MRILTIALFILVGGCNPIPINSFCNAPLLASEYSIRTVELFESQSIFSSSCPNETPRIQEISLNNGNIEVLITTGKITPKLYLVAQNKEKVLNITGGGIRSMPKSKESMAERFKKYTHFVNANINSRSITFQVSGSSESVKETVVLNYTLANCNCVTYDAI